MLDLAGPAQLICTLKELGIASPPVHYVGPQRELRSFQQVSLSHIEPLPKKLRSGDIVFMIGSKLPSTGIRSPEVIEIAAWLQDVCAASDVEVFGVCTGTFLLGYAGLLDGRICTTHHNYIDRLKAEFPRAKVIENRVFVRDDTLVTSGGVTAGIDATLLMIEHYFGATNALRVARENNVHFRRFGADPILSSIYRYRNHVNVLIHSVQDWMSAHSDSGISCVDIAEKFNVSYRHLARLFLQETGVTLKHYQLMLRLDSARQLLRQAEIPLEIIADRCGFGSIQALRASWKKYETCTLSVYRKKFVKAMVS